MRGTVTLGPVVGTVAVNAKALKQALSAVLLAVSEDHTRAMLYGRVHVKVFSDAVQFTTSDGHRVHRVKIYNVPDTTRANVEGVIDGARVAALLKLEREADYTIEICGEGEFKVPEIDRVIPEKRTEGEALPFQGVDMRLMADFGKAQKALGLSGSRLQQFAGEHAPCRVDMGPSGPSFFPGDLTFVGVLMPMRL